MAVGDPGDLDRAERGRQQPGVPRLGALGAHRGQIRAQFLTEAVVLSALGGIGGTPLGITATTGYAWSQNWPVVIPAGATLAGLGGAALIGAVAGAYPAMRAARLMPTEALSGT
ncbi:ABC transporter permease [Actinoplanes sp. NPDC020271]|uniref:ABC transporter permease n=1 Tax=Actinoplanes sp. NPDC020271 TaxID=3363896 RepID=UPI0037A7E2F1